MNAIKRDVVFYRVYCVEGFFHFRSVHDAEKKYDTIYQKQGNKHKLVLSEFYFEDGGLMVEQVLRN